MFWKQKPQPQAKQRLTDDAYRSLLLSALQADHPAQVLGDRVNDGYFANTWLPCILLERRR